MTAPIVIPYRNTYGQTGTVLGFPTGVPGLVVNEATDPCDGGCYLVTHARSGTAFPYCWESPEGALAHVHDVAALVDWTVAGSELKAALPDRLTMIDIAARRGGTLHMLAEQIGDFTHDNGVIA